MKFIVSKEQTSTGYWYKLFSPEGKQLAHCFETIHGDGLDEPAPAPFKTNADWVFANPVPGTEKEYGAGLENIKYEIEVQKKLEEVRQ